MYALLRVVGAVIALFVLDLLATTFGFDPTTAMSIAVVVTALGVFAVFRITRQSPVTRAQNVNEPLLEAAATVPPDVAQAERPVVERSFAPIDNPTRKRWPVARIVGALAVLLVGAHWALVSEINGLTRDTLANWLKDKPYIISRIDVPLTALFSSSYQLSVTLQGSSDANSLAVLRPTVDGFCLIGGCTEAISGQQLLVLTMNSPS